MMMRVLMMSQEKRCWNGDDGLYRPGKCTHDDGRHQ
jgi:hypothetical protein